MTKFPKASFAVAGGDIGSDDGGGFGAVAIGVAVDYLLPERVIESLDDALRLELADQREVGRESMELLLVLEVVQSWSTKVKCRI